MPEYLWVGTNKENIMKGTHEAHLVMCLDCGFVIELIGDGVGTCSCREYIIKEGKWVFRTN
jgi:hypothetical protein